MVGMIGLGYNFITIFYGVGNSVILDFMANLGINIFFLTSLLFMIELLIGAANYVFFPNVDKRIG